MTHPPKPNDLNLTTQKEEPQGTVPMQSSPEQNGVTPRQQHISREGNTKTVTSSTEHDEETGRLSTDPPKDVKSQPNLTDSPTSPKPLSPKDLETTAQFIEYIYSKKGKVKPTLTPEISKAISNGSKITADELKRLLWLARDDKTLSVPRPLLLDSQQSYVPQVLRSSLRTFILEVMTTHPIFRGAQANKALRNLPDALSEQGIFNLCQQYNPDPKNADDRLTKTELRSLRINAAYLFSTWIALQRGRSIDELTRLLYQTVWLPAADDLPDDLGRLRALTNLNETAGIGLACKRFHSQEADAKARYQRAERDLEITNTQLQQAQAQLDAVTERAADLQDRLNALHTTTNERLREVEVKRTAEVDHLKRDLRDLKGRLFKELTKAKGELETGLSALQFSPPKTHIMNERAEDVVKLLSSEIARLKG